MPDQKTEIEKRRHERFAIEFPVEISGVSSAAEEFSDRGKMKNVSGGGLCFQSQHAGWYAVGQKVAAHVFMPGTDEMAAGMECTARVAWMHYFDETDDGQQALVGLCLDGFMTFETRTLREQADGRGDSQ